MDHKAAIKRRDFLNWSTHGIGGAALSSMFLEDGFASQPINPHYAPNVKQVIHICLCGGFSQVDSFDYKPKIDLFRKQYSIKNVVKLYDSILKKHLKKE